MDDVLERLQQLAAYVSLERGDKVVVSRRDNSDGKGEFVVHDYLLEESFYYDLAEVETHLETIFQGDANEA